MSGPPVHTPAVGCLLMQYKILTHLHAMTKKYEEKLDKIANALGVSPDPSVSLNCNSAPTSEVFNYNFATTSDVQEEPLIPEHGEYTEPDPVLLEDIDKWFGVPVQKSSNAPVAPSVKTDSPTTEVAADKSLSAAKTPMPPAKTPMPPQLVGPCRSQDSMIQRATHSAVQIANGALRPKPYTTVKPIFVKPGETRLKCHHCGTTTTWTWRKVDLKVTCDACYQYYKHHRMFKPIESLKRSDDRAHRQQNPMPSASGTGTVPTFTLL